MRELERSPLKCAIHLAAGLEGGDAMLERPRDSRRRVPDTADVGAAITSLLPPTPVPAQTQPIAGDDRDLVLRPTVKEGAMSTVCQDRSPSLSAWPSRSASPQSAAPSPIGPP